MHQAPRPVASTRSRRSRLAAVRRPLEALESRVLFAAGDFDLTFGGGDGATLVNFAPGSADFGAALAVLPDGKMIVGGSVGNGTNTDDSFGLTKLNADGSLDLTFGGGDGMVTLDTGPGDADLNAIAIAPDGKIVAVGSTAASTTWDWAVARFNADGTPDTTFGGGDGIVTTDFFGFGDDAYGVDVQPDGKIVVTGVDTAATSDMAVVRYNTDGSLDSTFDGDGKVFVNFFGGIDFASNIKVQPDNKLIIVGGSVRPGFYRQFVLVRLNPNGSPDSTFGNAGLATADFGASAFGKDVELLANGQYVVGGWVDTQPTGNDQLDLAVARFNPNGALDGTFGTNGRTVFTGTGGEVFGSYGLEVQQNGKILVGGTTKDPNYETNFQTYAGVARVNANGSPDTTFGPGGVRQFTIPGTPVGDSNVADLELAPDGGILVAGYPFLSGGGTDFAVVKLQNDDGPPPLPGSVAGVVYNDANANGVRDAGEAGLPNWTLFRDLNGNGVFDAGAVTVNSTDVPKTISPVGSTTVFSSIDVPNLGSNITDVDVTLDITHSFDSDLTVWLINPAGTRIQLFRHVGDDGHNFTGTILDDEATQSITTGTAPFTGRFRPAAALSAFDGTSPTGRWQLEVFDEFNEDGGQLNSWSLAITTQAEPTVISGADGSYVFQNLAPGTHRIGEVVQAGWTQTAPAGGIHVVDVASGQAVTGRDFGNFNGVINSTVVDRRMFYNGSAFDGNNPAADATDDAAIATNKSALLPGGTGSSANVSSYVKGINGVMIDMTKLSRDLAADDFEFRVGDGGSPSTWALAPAPLSVTERPSGRPDGATRVSIVWADNAIRNTWLQVRVKANADTALAADDVFYFGNLVGETPLASAGGPLKVDGTDVLATRNGPRGASVPVGEPADHNKDGRVNVLDETIVRNNFGRTLTTLAAPAAAAFGDVAIQAARRARGVPITRSVLA